MIAAVLVDADLLGSVVAVDVVDATAAGGRRCLPRVRSAEITAVPS